MNLTKTFMLAALLGAAASVPAQTTDSFTFTVNKPVPDGDASGLVATSTNLSGYASDWSIDQVRLTLNLSGGYNGDLYAYLAHDAGGFAVLLNRVGFSTTNGFGYADAGLNALTFQDGQADVHFYQTVNGGGGVPTGLWSPDGRTLNPLTTPSVSYDGATRPASLLTFNNTSPNGQWTLFLADLSLGAQTTVTSWTLELRTVPEPAAGLLGLLGGGLLLWARRRRAG